MHEIGCQIISVKRAAFKDYLEMYQRFQVGDNSICKRASAACLSLEITCDQTATPAIDDTPQHLLCLHRQLSS